MIEKLISLRMREKILRDQLSAHLEATGSTDQWYVRPLFNRHQELLDEIGNFPI